MAKKSKKVLIEYLIDEDEITVKSEFRDPARTLKLIQMGMEKWINELMIFIVCLNVHFLKNMNIHIIQLVRGVLN